MSGFDLLVSDIAPPSDRDFALFQRLIHEESGIFLAPTKKELLVARLRRRLRELGQRSFKSYYACVVDDAAERGRLLDCISTNETRFFREPQQLAFLTNRVLPRLQRLAQAGQRVRRLRVWSAGCATGEEPYTLAMILRHALPAQDGWGLELLASDLSQRALEVAEQGCYPLERAGEIPEPYLKTYMLKGVRASEGWMTVGPEARSLVRFARINLHTDAYPPGPFDLVLCRNVLIYFDAATRERVVGRLVECLAPAGLLLLGHAENLSGSQQHGLRYAGPLTYGRPTEGSWW
jgi:chemotaxis protein methyltransferase CheR